MEYWSLSRFLRKSTKLKNGSACWKTLLLSPPGFMHVKNTLYQHQNFSAAAFNRGVAKSQISSAGRHNKGGTAVSSYYEVPRVVAIPHDGEYIATTAFTHRVTQAILLRLRRGRASLTHVVR